jgi:hypothetical protein
MPDRRFSSAALLFFLSIVGLSLGGCSPGRGGGGGDRDAGQASSDGSTAADGARGRENTNATCSDGMDNDGDGNADCDDRSCFGLADCGGGVGDAGFDQCATSQFEAESSIKPVDIVWAIDNSGSMSEEASLVQENINSFAQAIGESGIPYRVVVMTQDGYVDVPPPLGNDSERYRFVAQNVSSNHALLQLVQQYDRYKDFLRNRAVMHFVIVSDDESEEMSHDTFQTMMEGMLGKTFRAHAIVSPPGSMHTPLGGGFSMTGCGGPNGNAAENGVEYWDLAADTGGRRFSICTEDWSSLFDTLTEEVAVPQTLPCSFERPEAPEGEEFDKLRVNVVVKPGDGSQRVVPYVEQRSNCDGPGWYYDDPENPTRIDTCPVTCTRLEANDQATVEIAYGCQTIII